LDASPIDTRFFKNRDSFGLVRYLFAEHFIAMSAFVCIAAQMGDLVKSAVKRWAGVKDSGRLLPEFGGTLDMVDSFILNAPAAIVAYEVLRLVAEP
jgi:CDP-diglyceride synthetase